MLPACLPLTNCTGKLSFYKYHWSSCAHALFSDRKGGQALPAYLKKRVSLMILLNS